MIVGHFIIIHMFESTTSDERQLHAAVERALAAITEITDLLTADVLDLCPDSTLTSLTTRLAEIEDRAAASSSTLVARLDRSGVVRAEGFLSTRAWMDARLRNPGRENAQILRTARLLSRCYPATHRSWLGHVITRAHADAISNGIESAVKGLDAHTRDQARIDAERLLLEISSDHSPDVARAAVTRIRLAADPDGAKAAAVEADGKQWFSLTPVSDGWLCKGWFDNITGTALATVLEGRRNSRHHTGQTSPVAFSSSPGDETHDDEQAAKRVRHENALVLGEIATELLNSDGAGRINGERPHIEISVTLAELAQGNGYGELVTPGSPRRLHTTPIDIDTVRQMTCDGDIRRVISTGVYRDPDTGARIDPVIGRLLAAPTEVVDYGRAQRIVPPGLKRQLALRDQGCVFPGCRRPPSMTEAHHVLHWSAQGTTDLNNLALLCARHHTDVHTRGWTIKARSGHQAHQPGFWEIQPPRPPNWADTG